MRRLGDSEAGMTIIEAVVAALVLTVGALASFGLLSSATKNTQRAKATQVALDRAQQELEAIRSMDSEERALITTPPHSDNSLNPNYRVNATNATFALDREPLGNYQKLVYNGGELYGGTGEEGVVSGGKVSPGPTPFTSGDVSGEIYRYIVWRNDDACGEACPGEQDFKQIIVAVKLDKAGNQSAERGYVEVQSKFVDPTDSSESDPAPGAGGKVVTAQQFFLSDTPCAASGVTVREEISGDHLLHNTLGLCADGLKTGSEEEGAPDALVLGPPPDPYPEDENLPLLYDYANDSYLEPTPDTDRGLQLKKDETAGCHYTPTGTSHPESQVHRWVTDPLEVEFTLTDSVTLEYYTRTLNNEADSAQLCVYLFVRHEQQEEGGPLEGEDTLFTQSDGTEYWTETRAEWPNNGWKALRLVDMKLKQAPYTIPAGDRLGVALSVERVNTAPGDAIALMYDHPDYRARIEVDTSTPISGG